MKSIKMNFSRVQTTHVSRVQTTPFSRVQTTPRPQSAEEKTACLKQVVNLVFPFQALNLHFRARIPLGRPEAGPEPDLQTGCVRIQYSPFGARIPLSGPEAGLESKLENIKK